MLKNEEIKELCSLEWEHYIFRLTLACQYRNKRCWEEERKALTQYIKATEEAEKLFGELA